MRDRRRTIGLAVTMLGLIATGAAGQARMRAAPSTAYFKAPMLAAPNPVTVTQIGATVEVAWQSVAEAQMYEVIRSPDTTSAVWNVSIAGAYAPITKVTDRYPGRGFYRVTTVAADGRRAASGWVQYPTPGPAPAVLTGTKGGARRGFGIQITGITGPYPPNQGQLFVDTDDTVTVSGANLSGASIALIATNRGSDGAYRISTAQTFPQSIVPGGGLRFIPAAPIGYRTMDPFYVVVTRSIFSDTSVVPIFIGRAPVVRKITQVEQVVIRSGLRFKIHGVGFDEVIGGYAGTGTRGSIQNPLLSMWNRGPTYVELATTPTCDLEGPVMLEMPVPGGSPQLVTGDQPIMVACVPENPSGTVVGTSGPPTSPTNTINVKAGSTVTITGKYLRWVSRVLDQRNLSLPFTLQKGATHLGDRLTVTLPTAVGVPYGFYLENVLTDPVFGTQVNGVVITVP